MSKSWFRRPDHCISVQIFVVACFAASLAHYGCEAQFLLNDGGGLSVLPPGLRLSQVPRFHLISFEDVYNCNCSMCSDVNVAFNRVFFKGEASLLTLGIF